VSLHTYGGLAAPLAALAILLFSAGLALIYGAGVAAYRALCEFHARRATRVIAFAALWTAAELVRGNLWTGFPWGAGGYAHIDSLLHHWAPWFGVYGLTAISAAFAMWLGAQRQTQRQSERRISGPTRGLAALALVALAYTWVQSPTQQASVHRSSRPLSVSLLQGNIPQDLKFGVGVNQALQFYGQALVQTQADLVITPETAIPLLPSQLPLGYWADLQTKFAQGQQAALIGLPIVAEDAQGRAQYANAAWGVAPNTPPYQYLKHHLVPFGEFVPPLFQWFVQQLNIPLGEFQRGAPTQAPMLWKGERIAPNICYEDLFGEELARNFALPDQAPSLIVNMSNIAWFGNTIAIEQHLNISRMRALELGRPILRATNTGATAWIDEQGVVQARLPSATQGQLNIQVHGVHGPITPYARWVAAWGLWPFALVIMSVVLVLVIHRRQSRATSGS
jgi:apolipoprotein N-acyltransferase